MHLTKADRPSRILIVDDSSTARVAIHRALAPLGSDFEFADAATTALEMHADSPFDLITMDLLMPGLTGQQMLQLLRETHPLVPVLVVTGIRETDFHALYDLGANAIILKPFNDAMLYAVAHALLEGASGRLWMR